MLHLQFPPGTNVRVRQTIAHRSRPVRTEVVGVVAAWEELPTGSWMAGGKNGKLWLKRLKIRKPDGEIALLVIDEGTSVDAVDAPPASTVPRSDRATAT